MIADHNPIQPAPGLRTASDPGPSKAVAKQLNKKTCKDFSKLILTLSGL